MLNVLLNMKKLRTFISFLLIAIVWWFPVFSTYAQQNILDSLLGVLKTVKDTQEVNTLNYICRQYYSIANYDSAWEYAQQAKQKAIKEDFKSGHASALLNMGIISWYTAKYSEALDNYTKALNLFEQINNKKGQGNCYNNMGLVYLDLGDHSKAIDNILKGLKLREEINDEVGVCMAYLNIGNIYLQQANNEKALEYYQKSLKMSEGTGYKDAQAKSLNNMGVIYQNFENYDKALEYYQKALDIEEELGDKHAIAMGYNNVGLIYKHKKEYEKALASQFKSVEMCKSIGNTSLMAVSYTNIATIYTHLKKYGEAERYGLEALEICKKTGYKSGILDAYASLSELYESKGDYKAALNYHKLYKSTNDSLINEASGRQIEEMNTKYGTEKKDKEILLLNKEKEIATAEGRKQQILLLSVCIVLLLVVIFAVITYRNNKLKQQLNEELEKLSIVASETDNGVLICGPNGEIEWANSGLHRLLGYTFDELKQKGKTISELSSNPDIKKVIQHSITNKQSSTYQVLNTTKEGEERWTQSTLTPILDNNGNIKKLVIIDTDITNRKKIEEQLTRQNTELEDAHKNLLLLSEIGQVITSSLSVEKIVEKAYSSINRLMDADIFCIGIHNKEKNTVDFPGFIEKGQKFNSSYDLNDEARLPVLCFKYRKEIFINDLSSEYHLYIPYLPPPIAGEQPESLIYLPLLLGDKLIGVINVESFRKNAYTSYHLNILKNLAVYVAIALENAQLYQGLEEKIKERTAELVKRNEEVEKMYENIQIMNEIGQEITSTLDLGKVLDTVYAKVNSLMDATEFGFGILDMERQAIDFSNYYYEGQKMSGDLDTWVSLEDNNRLSVWCIKNRKPVFINNMQNEYGQYISDLESYTGEGKLLLESVICLPLILEERLIGIISVQSPTRNAYSRNHLEILQTLASYIAIALDNARLYENMEDEVTTRTKEIEQQKILVEEKNMKITDSINYALRIQQAILPSREMINSLLPDSFIFFKPKDIVSGDFYWAHAIDTRTILYAAIDCTGHGVPGAFMSIMGYNLLEQIVKEKEIYQPAAILNELSKMVVEALKQTYQIGSLKEGMDIALCKIDYNIMELEYAGAHNSLNIVRQGILTETKANRRSIGIALPDSPPFVNHKIKLEKNDCIYIFSDGYADQQGGAFNKKFFTKPLHQFLIDIHTLPMKTQEQKLEQVITEWKGSREQIDDMLVIGVRV